MHDIPWDISTHLHIMVQTPPYVMAPRSKLIIFQCPRDMTWFLFMACVICPWDILTHLHSVSKTPVCHGARIETDFISMYPGHELIPVHGMRDMFLGHIDTFAFCINTFLMSWRLDDDWLYFHVPGTWIRSCSWHAWYVPGTYRHIYILYQNPQYVLSPGWRLNIFPCPRDMN